MGTYFQRNYRQGERLEIPDQFAKGKNREWNKWKERRLQDLEFYDEDNMRLGKYRETDKAPPRIHLRGDGDSISESSLDAGHLEFKVWLQNKIEEVASGKGSPKFLSEQGRESERNRAMEKWEGLTDALYESFLNRYFTKSNIEDIHFRESRHLMLLRKIVARKKPDWRAYLYDDWVFADAGVPPLPPHLGTDTPNLLERICRETIRVLIGSSRSSEPAPQLLSICVPAMTFIEKLQHKVSTILHESCELARLYSPDEKCGPKDMEFDEKKTLEEINERGFGSLDGVSVDKTWQEVTNHNSVAVAYDIMNMLLEEGFLQRRYMTNEEYLDYFLDGDESLEKPRSNKRLPHQLVFTKHLKEMIGDSEYEHFDDGREHPIYRWLRGEQDRWMYCPPVPHRYGPPISEGGLLTPGNRRLFGGSHDTYEEFGTPRGHPSKRIVESLNALQGTQWEINFGFLSALFDIELNDGTSLSADQWRDKEARIKVIRAKKEFADVFTPTDSESRASRTLVLEWARRIIEHNANVFWHSWICDFRGRMFPRCPKLSPVGDDLDRAMIRFKHWKPLGDAPDDTTGIFWIHVHVHNMMEGIESDLLDGPASKGRTFVERSDWVERNLETLLRMASEPANHLAELHLDRYVPGKSHAFQRLAALTELNRTHLEWEGTHKDPEKRDWSKVSSGQPIYLDASCNGYQHVAALLRDRDLAYKVNIIGKGSPRDLYGIVADNADASYARDLFSKILNGPEVDDAVYRTFNRNTAKMPTMTRVYGSKDIPKCLQGRNQRGRPKFSDPVPYQLSDKEQREYDAIPDAAKVAHKEWRSDDDLNFKHFMKHAIGKSGKPSEYTAKKWKKLLDELRALALWNDGSGLQMALLKQADSISDAFTEHEEMQPQLTKLVAASLETSIKQSTGSAFDILEKTLKKICRSSDGLHPGIRWGLPDGFVVMNYYIRHHQADKTKRGMPCHTGSAFTPMVPLWYGKNVSGKAGKSSARIFARVKELYSGHVSLKGEKELNDALTGKLRMSRRHVEAILRKVDPNSESDEANEIRKVLLHANVSLLRFAVAEKERIHTAKLKRGMAPNFVHSLDAYHMRTVVGELSDAIQPFSFWAVHDAFGVHACDVPAMREVVTRTFQEMHSDRDLLDWLEVMAEPFGIDFEEDPLSTQGGLPEMLGDIWPGSRTKLDISEVVDAEYLIS